MVSDWTVTPLTGALGARVEGPHLSTLDAAGWDQLDKLLIEHKVLALPGQRLTPAEQVELAARFGQPYHHRFLPTVPGHPAVVEAVEESGRPDSVIGDQWVSDLSFRSPPGAISVLAVKELSRYGGDTLFLDSVSAYRRLSETMRSFVDRLRAVHVFPGVIETSQSSAVHPLVRSHPTTAERALFVNPAYMTRIEGLTAAESRAMIDFLTTHAADPDLICRVTWTPDQVMLWDNRSTLRHSAQDYPGQRRRYHLVTAIER